MNPFERKKDKVAIVGFSKMTRYMAPFDKEEYEIWGLNEEYAKVPTQIGQAQFEYKTWMKRYDRWLQLHPREDFMRKTNTNDRNHPLWLLNTPGQCMACAGTTEWPNFLNGGVKEKCPFCEDGTYHPLPGREGLIIYMQEAYPDIPGSVKFPLKQLSEHLMSPMMKRTHRDRYWRSSPALELSLAMAMGYKTIGLYGFEMGTDTEYHYQRANFEYWIGKAEGMGIEIELPEESSLLQGELYAYETMKVGYRQDLEMRKVFLEQRVKAAIDEQREKSGAARALKLLLDGGKYLKVQGEKDVMEVMTKEDIDAAYKDAEKERVKAQSMSNFKSGAHKEVELGIKMYDAYFNTETREDKETKTVEIVNTDYKYD